jgi:hypothetical protein
MAIGTTIRTDAPSMANEIFSQAHRRPMILHAKYQYPRVNRNEEN